jgi:hypothetical protein
MRRFATPESVHFHAPSRYATRTRIVMQDRETKLLRWAFMAGAVTDALALVPMLIPEMARILWGFDDPTGSYRFAMGYGASLMLGWTVLLLWAYQRPRERRFVSAMTVIVIYGLVLTEVLAVRSGAIELARMVPTFILQAGLLALFASAYHYPQLVRHR